MKVAAFAFSLFAWTSAFALGVPKGPFAGPALEAAKRGDCESAVGFLNRGIEAKDAEALFWIGRMLDLGTCVTADPERATKFFSAAEKAGSVEGRLELSTKYGLGVGVEQSYERAGELARSAGLKVAADGDNYTIGYANTVRGIAQRKLVDSIPSDLLQQAFSGTVEVQFFARSQQINVKPGPQFAMRTDSAIGSNLRRGRRDVIRATEDVWRDAISKVPSPEAARLVDSPLTMDLYIDVKVEPIDPMSLMPMTLTPPKSTFAGGS